MVYAAGRPARWTPAETEWQGWINNADDAVIEASHWQIMMEAPTFRLVRNTLRAGFAQPQRNRRTRYDAVRLPKTTRTDCGRQIWRNVPECLYAAPGWNWSACWREEAPVQESWLMRLAFRCIPRRNR